MSAALDRSKVRALFEAACDLPAEERLSYLHRACADDHTVRAEVESLLAFDSVAVGAFSETRLVRDRGIAAPEDEHARAPDAIPPIIGPYRIIRRIGGGGMGEVFEAEQAQPHRRVALKVMHSGGSHDLARRMRREGQIQGGLNHPGIVHVFESGVHNSAGRSIPYFAMELVDGEPITAWCSRRGTSLRQRIELMARVCDAVSHAHQRGVIHRDLKPDNILVVASPSDQPMPKVLDFGIAKMMGTAAPLLTTGTQEGQLVGTLAFMSPEQVGTRADEVDTRTDVYALGLILYELVCGQPARRTAGLSLPGAARLVAETDPTRPSLVNSEIRGDLETIVTKAIERQKERRYASVPEFGADLLRFLRSEPISAHPPSAAYLTRKFVARNPALAAAAVAIIVVLVLSSVITTTLAISRDRASALAAAREREAVAAKQDAESISGFLESTLASVAPAVALGKDTAMLRDVLDRAAARSESELSGHPLVLARLRTTIGETYRELGELPSAESQLTAALRTRRAALGPNNRDTLHTAHETALLYQEQSRLAEALDLARDTLARRAALLGPNHPEVLESESLVGWVLNRQEKAEALSVLRGVVPRMERVLGRNDLRTIKTLVALSVACERDDLLKESELLKTDVLTRCEASLGSDHPQTLTAMNNLGILLERLGKWTEAEAILSRTLDARRRVLGADHPQTQNSMVNVASHHTRRGHPAKAVLLVDEALVAARKTLGPDHFRIGHAQQVRGMALSALGRMPEADAALNDAYRIFTLNYGERAARTLQAAEQLATLHETWEGASPGEGHTRQAIEWRGRSQRDAPSPD